MTLKTTRLGPGCYMPIDKVGVEWQLMRADDGLWIGRQTARWRESTEWRGSKRDLVEHLSAWEG